MTTKRARDPRATILDARYSTEHNHPAEYPAHDFEPSDEHRSACWICEAYERELDDLRACGHTNALGAAEHTCYPDGSVLTLWTPQTTYNAHRPVVRQTVYIATPEGQRSFTAAPHEARAVYDDERSRLAEAQT